MVKCFKCGNNAELEEGYKTIYRCGFCGEMIYLEIEGE